MWSTSKSMFKLLGHRPHQGYNGWFEIILQCCHFRKRRKKGVNELQCSLWRFHCVSTHRGMTGHLHPRRRCPGLESPASHRSNCHGVGCQGMGMSSLECYHWSSNLFMCLLFNTSEIVEPSTCFFSPCPLEALWIVTASLVLPHSALMLGIGAPVQVSPRIGGYWPTSSLSILGTLKDDLTRSGVVCTIARGTKRGSKCWALPFAADPLTTSHLSRGVVWFTTGDLARVVGKGEGVVKEIHWWGICGGGFSWEAL